MISKTALSTGTLTTPRSRGRNRQILTHGEDETGPSDKSRIIGVWL